MLRLVSNHGLLVLESMSLPTEPRPLPIYVLFYQISVVLSKYHMEQKYGAWHWWEEDLSLERRKNNFCFVLRISSKKCRISNFRWFFVFCQFCCSGHSFIFVLLMKDHNLLSFIISERTSKRLKEGHQMRKNSTKVFPMIKAQLSHNGSSFNSPTGLIVRNFLRIPIVCYV